MVAKADCVCSRSIPHSHICLPAHKDGPLSASQSCDILMGPFQDADLCYMDL